MSGSFSQAQVAAAIRNLEGAVFNTNDDMSIPRINALHLDLIEGRFRQMNDSITTKQIILNAGRPSKSDNPTITAETISNISDDATIFDQAILDTDAYMDWLETAPELAKTDVNDIDRTAKNAQYGPSTLVDDGRITTDMRVKNDIVLSKETLKRIETAGASTLDDTTAYLINNDFNKKNPLTSIISERDLLEQNLDPSINDLVRGAFIKDKVYETIEDTTFTPAIDSVKHCPYMFDWNGTPRSGKSFFAPLSATKQIYGVPVLAKTATERGLSSPTDEIIAEKSMANLMIAHMSSRRYIDGITARGLMLHQKEYAKLGIDLPEFYAPDDAVPIAASTTISKAGMYKVISDEDITINIAAQHVTIYGNSHALSIKGNMPCTVLNSRLTMVPNGSTLIGCALQVTEMDVIVDGIIIERKSSFTNLKIYNSTCIFGNPHAPVAPTQIPVLEANMILTDCLIYNSIIDNATLIGSIVYNSRINFSIITGTMIYNSEINASENTAQSSIIYNSRVKPPFTYTLSSVTCINCVIKLAQISIPIGDINRGIIPICINCVIDASAYDFTVRAPPNIYYSLITDGNNTISTNIVRSSYVSRDVVSIDPKIFPYLVPIGDNPQTILTNGAKSTIMAPAEYEEYYMYDMFGIDVTNKQIYSGFDSTRPAQEITKNPVLKLDSADINTMFGTYQNLMNTKTKLLKTIDSDTNEQNMQLLRLPLSDLNTVSTAFNGINAHPVESDLIPISSNITMHLTSDPSGIDDVAAFSGMSCTMPIDINEYLRISNAGGKIVGGGTAIDATTGTTERFHHERYLTNTIVTIAAVPRTVLHSSYITEKFSGRYDTSTGNIQVIPDFTAMLNGISFPVTLDENRWSIVDPYFTSERVNFKVSTTRPASSGTLLAQCVVTNDSGHVVSSGSYPTTLLATFVTFDMALSYAVLKANRTLNFAVKLFSSDNLNMNCLVYPQIRVGYKSDVIDPVPLNAISIIGGPATITFDLTDVDYVQPISTANFSGYLIQPSVSLLSRHTITMATASGEATSVTVTAIDPINAAEAARLQSVLTALYVHNYNILVATVDNLIPDGLNVIAGTDTAANTGTSFVPAYSPIVGYVCTKSFANRAVSQGSEVAVLPQGNDPSHTMYSITWASGIEEQIPVGPLLQYTQASEGYDSIDGDVKFVWTDMIFDGYVIFMTTGTSYSYVCETSDPHSGVPASDSINALDIEVKSISSPPTIKNNTIEFGTNTGYVSATREDVVSLGIFNCYMLNGVVSDGMNRFTLQYSIDMGDGAVPVQHTISRDFRFVLDPFIDFQDKVLESETTMYTYTATVYKDPADIVSVRYGLTTTPVYGHTYSLQITTLPTSTTITKSYDVATIYRGASYPSTFNIRAPYSDIIVGNPVLTPSQLTLGDLVGTAQITYNISRSSESSFYNLSNLVPGNYSLKYSVSAPITAAVMPGTYVYGGIALASIRNCTLAGYVFIDIDFMGTTLTYCVIETQSIKHITNCTLVGCKIANYILTNCTLTDCDLYNCIATDCNITQSNTYGSLIYGDIGDQMSAIRNFMLTCFTNTHAVIGGSCVSCLFKSSTIGKASIFNSYLDETAIQDSTVYNSVIKGSSASSDDESYAYRTLYDADHPGITFYNSESVSIESINIKSIYPFARYASTALVITKDAIVNCNNIVSDNFVHNLPITIVINGSINPNSSAHISSNGNASSRLVLIGQYLGDVRVEHAELIGCIGRDVQESTISNSQISGGQIAGNIINASVVAMSAPENCKITNSFMASSDEIVANSIIKTSNIRSFQVNNCIVETSRVLRCAVNGGSVKNCLVAHSPGYQAGSTTTCILINNVAAGLGGSIFESIIVGPMACRGNITSSVIDSDVVDAPIQNILNKCVVRKRLGNSVMYNSFAIAGADTIEEYQSIVFGTQYTSIAQPNAASKYNTYINSEYVEIPFNAVAIRPSGYTFEQLLIDHGLPWKFPYQYAYYSAPNVSILNKLILKNVNRIDVSDQFEVWCDGVRVMSFTKAGMALGNDLYINEILDEMPAFPTNKQLLTADAIHRFLG